jgi:hypothetical protein
MMDRTAVVLEDNLAALFQPDTVLSAQYAENFRRRIAMEPERKLALAVLEDGVRCFQHNVSARDEKGKKLFAEAEDWIVDTNGDWIFSFESVCGILGLDPRYVRQGLLGWKEKRSAKHRKLKAA